MNPAALAGFERRAIDPLHTGDALANYVPNQRIDLDYVPGVTQLAYLHELLTRAFGLDWVANGHIVVRFPAPLYNGDSVRVAGRLVSERDAENLHMVECEVWIERNDGLRTCSGTATCRITE